MNVIDLDEAAAFILGENERVYLGPDLAEVGL
jgi:hypothetical protein